MTMKLDPTAAVEALLDAAVERTIARLLPHLVTPRPEWTTSKNAKETFGGKTWRAVDEWAQRRRIARYSVAGSPAYKTADLDAAVEETASARDEEGKVDDLAEAVRKHVARRRR